MGLLDKVLRAGEGKAVKRLVKVAQEVNKFESEISALDDQTLRSKTEKFKERYAAGETLDSILPEAFAVVREAAKRTLGQRHYDVQLMGGAALHRGNIAEMRTGEGKTLVSTLPAYLNALTGKGVHIVTVNDYLAERDSEWMGRVHRFLGLKVGVILASMSPAERREAYAADITYGTNNEFGFDYLRDNMAWSLSDCVQRDHNFAIVDEVDSILIDEARTPLIISGPADKATKWYLEFASIVSKLTLDQHYEVDVKKRTIGILEEGVTRVEEALKIENLYEAANTPMIGYLNNAIRAKELFKRDKDYVVMNGDLLIVDEAHNFKHGVDEGVAIRNQIVSRLMGYISEEDKLKIFNQIPELNIELIKPKAKKVIFLSATPIDNGLHEIKQQFDCFLPNHKFSKSEAISVDIKNALNSFMIRGLMNITLHNETENEGKVSRNMYRHEHRRGNVEKLFYI